MKIMYKITTLMFVGFFVPAAMQANRLTRVLAHKVSRRAAVQLLKNPGVIAGGLGATSLMYSKWQDKRAQALSDETSSTINDSMSPEFARAMKVVRKHRNNATYSKKIAQLALGLAGNYFVFSQLKKHGYLPSRLTRNGKGLVALIPGLALIEERCARILDSLVDYVEDPKSSERTSKVAFAALKAYPWVGAEMILGPLTYLAFFA